MTDDLERRLRSIDFEGDQEIVEKLRQEARRTVDNQIRTREDMNEKAIRTIRHNVLLTGVLLTILSFVVKSTDVGVADFFNGYVIVGVVALVLSSSSAALTYGRTDVAVGIDPDDVVHALELDLTDHEFQTALAKSYATWIDRNTESHETDASFVNLTVVLLVVAISYLSLGTYVGMVGQVPSPLVVGANGLIGFVGWRVGLGRQIGRMIHDWGVSLRRTTERL